MKIKKAVIPAAGLGTRFLPASKAQPKEMLPIIDKPTIQYIVEEAVEAGIEDIVIVISRGKQSIEDHFDKSYELEDVLLRKNKTDLLAEVRKVSNLVNICYVRQKDPKGLGDAILTAKRFIGDEPFAVLLGDDIVMSKTPCLQQLMDIYQYYNNSVIAVQRVLDEEVDKYGIIEPKKDKIAPNLFHVGGLVEKPQINQAPSNYAIMGRYILTPEIFKMLETTEPGAGNELQLTDAINKLKQYQVVLAYEFEGRRFDIGDKVGFIKANIDFALQRNDTRKEILDYIEQVLIREKSQVSEEGFD